MEVPDCPPTPPIIPEGLASPKQPPDVGSSDSPTTAGQEGSVSPRSGSPEPNCPICLGQLDNKSYSDSCFHKFCFKCLLEWSKVKAECPLCKQKFKSIIHNVKSMDEYDQYTVQPAAVAEEERFMMMMSQLHQNSTMHLPRWWLRNQEVQRRHGNLPAQVTQPNERSLYELFGILPPGIGRSFPRSGSFRMNARNYRENSSMDLRRSIYRTNLWAQPLADVTGRTREFSLQFYRRNPATTHRLMPWISRDLSVLCEPTQIAVALELINNLLVQYDMRDPAFSQEIRGYLGEHTRHFTHELISFARSPYDMMGYDRHVRHSYWHPSLEDYGVVETHSSSEDDIVEVDVIPSTTSTSVVSAFSSDASRSRGSRDIYRPPTRSPSPEPGPSGISSFATNTPLVISSSDDDDNSTQIVANINRDDGSFSDVEVVAVVKPKHERTPEIIDLLSDTENTGNTLLPAASVSVPSSEPSTSFDVSNYFAPGPSTSNYSPNILDNSITEIELKSYMTLDGKCSANIQQDDSTQPLSDATLSTEHTVAHRFKHKKHKKSKRRIVSSDEDDVSDYHKDKHRKRSIRKTKRTEHGSDYDRKLNKSKHCSSSIRTASDKSVHFDSLSSPNNSEQEPIPSHRSKSKYFWSWKVHALTDSSDEDIDRPFPRIRSIVVKRQPHMEPETASSSLHSCSNSTPSDSDDSWKPRRNCHKKSTKSKGKGKKK